MLQRLKRWARRLKSEIRLLSAAIRDPRTPWYARALGIAVIAYALSPFDLIPDVIPVIGYLDELILLPAALWLVRRLIPPEVIEAHRAEAEAGGPLPPNRTAAIVIAVLWLAAVLVLVYFGWRWWTAPASPA